MLTDHVGSFFTVASFFTVMIEWKRDEANQQRARLDACAAWCGLASLDRRPLRLPLLPKPVVVVVVAVVS